MPIFEEKIVKESRYIKYVKKNDDVIAYKAQYPFAQTILFNFVVLLGLAGIIASIVLLNKQMLELYLACIIIAACALIFINFTYLVIRNKFWLKCENGAFILKQPLKPEKVLPCVNIEQVDITKFYSNRRSLKYLFIFWSRDGQRYFYFYNNGFLLKNDILIKLFDYYKIPYKIHK